MTEPLNVEGRGVPYPNPDDEPTEEIPVVQVEQPPSRLRRVGSFLLRGLQSAGRQYAGGYGAARMGLPPPRPPEIKTDTDSDDDDPDDGLNKVFWVR